MELNEPQIERYTHHLILKDIKREGQLRLLGSRVLIVGAGGLGSPAAYYLAAAGVGTIVICDGDRIELSNLQRQILYNTSEVGKHKSVAAQNRLYCLNPDVKVEPVANRFDKTNAMTLVDGVDFVLDCSDNFSTKYLIADTCRAAGLPYSYAGVVGFKGMTMTVSQDSACLRCVFPRPPEEGEGVNCRGIGIIGAVAGIFGSIQAAEAIKYIAKAGALLTNRLFTLDCFSFKARTLEVSKDPACPGCGGVLTKKRSREKNGGKDICGSCAKNR